MRLVPDCSRGRHRLAKPITDYSQAKPMPMTISMTIFDTQLKVSFIVYNITSQRLVLKEFWTCLMIKSLYTDAALRYLLGLICRVIFCCLSSHSRSLFSVIVSLCSKIETVCNKRSRNENKSLSLTLKKRLAFQHKLIHLHVASSLYNKNLILNCSWPFSRRGPRTWSPVAVSEMSSILRSGIPFSRGRGERERATVVLPYNPPPSPPPPSPNKEEDCLIQAKWIYASQRLVKGTSKNWVHESCVPRF